MENRKDVECGDRGNGVAVEAFGFLADVLWDCVYYCYGGERRLD